MEFSKSWMEFVFFYMNFFTKMVNLKQRKYVLNPSFYKDCTLKVSFEEVFKKLCIMTLISFGFPSTRRRVMHLSRVVNHILYLNSKNNFFISY